MRVLIDTNVLLRGIQFGHPMRQTADDALDRLRLDGHTPCVVPQVVYEFWVVYTRPLARNGFAKSPADAARAVDLILATFPFLPDSDAVFPGWRSLVAAYSVSGLPAHDARLVAAMRVHGLTHLLTFNIADFTRYPIVVLDPAVVAAPPTP